LVCDTRETQKTIDDIELTVKEIFKEVQKKGDEAIAKYTSLFDGVLIIKSL
jgi:histidinol dehydrogenase